MQYFRVTSLACLRFCCGAQVAMVDHSRNENEFNSQKAFPKLDEWVRSYCVHHAIATS